MNRNDQQIALLREIDAFLREARMRYWLRGGWALDFIIGKVTRAHQDIDLVTWKRHEARIKRAFADHGFSQTQSRPGTQLNFEKDGVDVQVNLVLRARGEIWLAGFAAPTDSPCWPEAAMDGPLYELPGLTCRVISAAGQLREKEKTPEWLGRKPREQDIQDMETLRSLLAAGAESRTTSRQRLGDFGERVAKAHLEAKGYRILATNFRVREGEVDIVAECDGVVAFVEVKTRRGDAMGSAVEAVDRRKAQRLLLAAEAFSQQHSELPPGRRIDLIAIDLDTQGRVVSLQHSESAVEEEG